jgi:hypothetical protein
MELPEMTVASAQSPSGKHEPAKSCTVAFHSKTPLKFVPGA